MTDTLEGPGIVKSQCPACKQPAWKQDLHNNHKYTAVAEATACLQQLLRAGASRTAGVQGSSCKPYNEWLSFCCQHQDATHLQVFLQVQAYANHI